MKMKILISYHQYLIILSIIVKTSSFPPGAVVNNTNNKDPSTSNFRFQNIVKAAFHHLTDFHLCTQTNIASEDQCLKLSKKKSEEVAVYLGFNSNNNNSSSSLVYAILPDSKSGLLTPHSGVVVLDPYPSSTFGHVVAMFYMDFMKEEDKDKCEEDQDQAEQGQKLIVEDDGTYTCLTLGHKQRCPNLLERLTPGVTKMKGCHVDFLPTVLPLEDLEQEQQSNNNDQDDKIRRNDNDEQQEMITSSPFSKDLLECVEIEGFSAPCPKLRAVNDTSHLFCEVATLSNSGRCDTSHTITGTLVPTCKLFQTCDRAVLIGGGWNRNHSPKLSLDNIVMMEEALGNLGFAQENIKTFYANGKLRRYKSPKPGRVLRAGEDDYYSSAMKTAMRGHIRTVCETRHCADTLFIYLNNPTNFEGDFLLWDTDYNGVADELETYTIKEFLSDLSGCEAKRVVVMVEQSNSDILMASLKTSVEHKNLIILTAGMPNQVLELGDFTSIWANNSAGNPLSCLRHVYQATASQMTSSSPLLFDSTSHSLSSKLSLIGAPCDLSPPVTNRELKTMYQNCQNVPTSVWFSLDVEEGPSHILDQDYSGSNRNKQQISGRTRHHHHRHHRRKIRTSRARRNKS